MRKLIYILTFVLLSSSCQKARLVEEWTEEPSEPGGRNSTTEQSDRTKVTPTFDAEDWEGVIDVNFGFGGEQTN